MTTRIHVTPEALDIITPAQRETLKRLIGNQHSIDVYTGHRAFLNGDWLSCDLHYSNGGGIELGISPEGDAHS